MTTVFLALGITLPWAVVIACTRNGRHLARVILLAVYRLCVEAKGEHALDQPAGAWELLGDMVYLARLNARHWAYRPVLWWRVQRIKRAVRRGVPIKLPVTKRDKELIKELRRRIAAVRLSGCLPAPETLPRRADPVPEEVPAPAPARGRAPLPPGGRLHPYKDPAPTRPQRFSRRVPSYYSDPAEAVGAATGDFPRLLDAPEMLP